MSTLLRDRRFLAGITLLLGAVLFAFITNPAWAAFFAQLLVALPLTLTGTVVLVSIVREAISNGLDGIKWGSSNLGFDVPFTYPEVTDDGTRRTEG